MKSEFPFSFFKKSVNPIRYFADQRQSEKMYPKASLNFAAKYMYTFFKGI
jgi:hypothetical protein